MENVQALLDPTTSAMENFIPQCPLMYTTDTGYHRSLIITPQMSITLTKYPNLSCSQYDDAGKYRKEQDINEVLSFIMDIEKILSDVMESIKK